MSIDLASIRRSVLAPPRIVVYGVPGIGKTTLAASAPSPIFIPVEDGLGQLDVQCFPKPQSFGEVLDMIGVLHAEDHGYQTVVIDSLDKLEPLVWQHVLDTVPAGSKKAATIEDYGYGKGYTHALSVWRDLLAGFDALRAKGMIVLAIAHSTIARFEPPDSDGYDRYQMRLHKGAEATICDWADCVLFANYKIQTIASGEGKRRGISDGSRVLLTNERASWRAKNRYSMPDEIPMDWPTVESFFLATPTNTTNQNQNHE